MKYESTKLYGHELGLSACFRQWKADSHCKFLHGYALSFKLTFGSQRLDHRGWVQDFGGLKDLKTEICKRYDHRLIVSHDDPKKEIFAAIDMDAIADVRYVERVGCEAFAEEVFYLALALVEEKLENKIEVDGIFESRVKVLSCECSEHNGNSAIYRRRV